MLAGTAYGNITTAANALLDSPPPNGTIFDRLSNHGISWRNYFTDVPMTFVIPSIVEHHPTHFSSISQFYEDSKNGALPSVSFVDPAVGALADLGSALESLPLLKWLLGAVGVQFGPPAATEEDP